MSFSRRVAARFGARDGTSEGYYLGEALDQVPTTTLSDGSVAFVLAMPRGDVTTDGAKLHPMKQHIGKLARHLASNTLIAHSTYEYFVTGDFGAAVRSGMTQSANMSTSDPYEVVPVLTYQTINHGVEPEDDALECSECHGSGDRMPLTEQLGYTLKAPESTLCTQCHRRFEPMTFTKLHDKHVKDKRLDCSFCHSFTRPERGLRTTLDGSGDSEGSEEEEEEREDD